MEYGYPIAQGRDMSDKPIYTSPESVTDEDLLRMANEAGLALGPDDIPELMPLYKLYLAHVGILHSIDLHHEEPVHIFRPD